MTHLDLFSGIGGFAYAADQVFGDVTHVFCDNEPFAQAVLHKHWPESYIFNDIRYIKTIGQIHKAFADTDRAGLQGQNAKQKRHRPSRRVDLLTGGFPCQPFSAAGLRRGTADDRHLWPEMLRVIRLTTPEWVIAENVGGITTWNDGLVFEQVCADLEAAGYEVQPFIIPAVATDAPHRRDRVWFVAHATRVTGRRGTSGQNDSPASQIQKRYEMGESTEPGQIQHVADPRRLRGQPGRGQTLQSQREKSEQPDSKQPRTGYSWNADWSEVAAEFCSVDDGLPAELDGFKLSKAQHRKKQLEAYGNAIVPQVAMQILQGIKEV